MIDRGRNNKGFTLIELILAITILVLVVIPFITFFSSTVRVTKLTQKQMEINAATRLVVNRVSEAIKDKNRELPLYAADTTQSLFNSTGGVNYTNNFFAIPEFANYKFQIKDPFATQNAKKDIFKFTNSKGVTLNGYEAIHMLTYFKNTSGVRRAIKDLRFYYYLSSDGCSIIKADGSADTSRIVFEPDGITSNLIIRSNGMAETYTKNELTAYKYTAVEKVENSQDNSDVRLVFGFNFPDKYLEKDDTMLTYFVFRYIHPYQTLTVTNDASYNSLTTEQPTSPLQPEYTKVPVVYNGDTIIGTHPTGVQLPVSSYLHVVDIDVCDALGKKVQRVQIEVTE